MSEDAADGDVELKLKLTGSDVVAAITNIAASLVSLDQKVENVNKKLQEMEKGKGFGLANTQIGQLAQHLSGVVPHADKLANTFGTLDSKSQAVATAVKATSTGMVVAGVSILGLVAAAALAITTVVGLTYSVNAGIAAAEQYADRYVNLSAQVGLGTEALQKYQFVAAQVGSSAEGVAYGVRRLQMDISKGGASTREAFDKLGVSLDMVRRMNPDQQFQTVLIALNKIPDQAKKTELAIQLLGRSGLSLVPMGAEFERQMKLAEQYGTVVSDSTLQAVDALGDAEGNLQTTMASTARQFFSAVASSGALKEGVVLLTEAWGALNRFVIAHKVEIELWTDVIVNAVASVLPYLVDLLRLASAGWMEMQLALKAVYYSTIQAFEGLKALVLIASHPMDIGKNIDVLQDAASKIAKSFEDEQKGMKAAVDAGMAREKSLESLSIKAKEAVDRIGAARRKLQDEEAPGKGGTGAGTGGLSEDVKAFHDKAAKMVEAAEKATLEQKRQAQKAQLDAELKGYEPHVAAMMRLDRERQDALDKLNDDKVEKLKALDELEKTNYLKANVERTKIEGEYGAQRLLLQWQFASRASGLQADAAKDRAAEEVDADQKTQAAREASYKRYLDKLRMGDEWYLTEYDKAVLEHTRRTWERVYNEIGLFQRAAADFGLETLSSALGDTVSLMDQFGKASEDGVISWGELASLVGSVYSNFKKIAQEENGAKRALSGALQMGGLGAKIGSSFGPMGAAIGGGIGAALGGIAGLISHHKPDFVRAGEVAGKILGGKVSEELSKDINKTAKDLKIDWGAATLLNLDKYVDESGRKWHEFGTEISGLFEHIRKGGKVGQEATAQLEKAWAGVRGEAEKYSLVGDKLTRQMLDQARANGALTAEMKDFLKSQASTAADAVAGLAGLEVTTKEQAERLARTFGLAFGQAISELGFVEGADKMREGFAALRDELSETFGQEYVDQLFAPFIHVFDITAEGSPFREAARAADAITQIFTAAANVGNVTQQTFNDLGASAQDVYNQALAAGATQGEAFALIQGMLQAAITASEQYGVTLDANTQRLIEQAKGAGVAFREDPMVRAANAMGLVAVALDKVFNLGLNVQSVFEGIAGAASQIEVPGVPSGSGSGVDTGDEGGPVYQVPNARGDVVEPRPGGKVMRVGEGASTEIVSPLAAVLDRMTQVAVQSAQAGGGGAPITVQSTIMLDGQVLARHIETAFQTGAIRVPADAVRS